MPAPMEHQLFKHIVLHNRLLSEAQVDQLLHRVPEVERAIQQMVAAGAVTPPVGGKLLHIYRKKLAEACAKQTEAAAPIEPVPTHVDDHPDDHPHVEPVHHLDPHHADLVFKLDRAEQGRALMEHLLGEARRLKASDLHVMSGEAPIVRVAASLHRLGGEALDAQRAEGALMSILNDRQREQFLEQMDLDFSFDGGAELGRFRCSYLRQHRGMDGVFRVIPDRVPAFEELGLPASVLKFTKYRLGVVLVTGPKNSGKTTTLAALVDLINRTRREHIITIEDPIEFVHPSRMGHVNQREVGRDTQSFANALRASLREAPDIIMVGELRDLETTSLAITAAETGHLVFGTLHTTNAMQTIGRILDVFPPREQPQIRAMFSESLRGIVSQHLIPTVDGESMVLAAEVLINTPAIGNLIREDRAFQIPGLMQTGKRLGMQLMDDALRELVKAGKIKAREAVIRATDKKRLAGDLGLSLTEADHA